MFTGIIEDVGTVGEATDEGRMRRLEIRAALSAELGDGDSVAVDGACFTVVDRDAESFRVDVIASSLSRTVAGRYAPGHRVNLERALRVGDRLDGHFVQGHVDGLGTLTHVVDEPDYRMLDFEIPDDVAEVCVPHGSIAINGVSLTINALPEPGTCQVAIIPFTWEHTNFRDLKVGDPVNLEGDLIGKHVGSMLARRRVGA